MFAIHFRKPLQIINQISLFISLFIGLAILSPQSHALTPQQEASFLFERLAGKPLTSRDPNYNKVITMIQSGKRREVAQMAAQEPGFVSATARQWGALMLSADSAPSRALDDTLSTILGATRDNMDARTLLYGDYIYAPDPRLGLEKPTLSNNNAYVGIESVSRELAVLLKYQSPQWNISGVNVSAGLFTTRGWAARNYSAGTNRRILVDAMYGFLCTPKEIWRTANLPTYRIRQDIDRAPSGNPLTFQQECRTCHSVMDPMMGAFAYLDFTNQTFTFNTAVQPKYLQNSQIYPEGYVTMDDSWLNFIKDRKDFGWRGAMEGNGPKEFGMMLANSQAFSRCMVKRTYTQVCGLSLEMSDATIVELANAFEKNGYKLKDLFIDVALESNCQQQGFNQLWQAQGGDYVNQLVNESAADGELCTRSRR